MSVLAASLAVAVLAAFGFVLRGVTHCPWVLADSYTHIYVASEIKRRRSLKLRLERYLYDASVADHLDYPPAFPTLLACLNPLKPGRAVLLSKWLPPLLDAIALVVAAVCSARLSGSATAAVVCAIIWLLAPCTHAQTIALSGRPLGTLVATLTFSAIAEASYGTGFATLLALVFGTVLILTNRLAVQAWAIMAAVFGVMGISLVPLATLVAAVFLSGALTWGLGWRVHAGHWRHLRRLRRLMPKKRWHQLALFSTKRNAPPPTRGYRLSLRAGTFMDLPWIWLAPLMWIQGAPVPADGIGWICVVWLSSLAVAGAIIQVLPGLRFVGEGFRYLEFALVPLAVLVALGLEGVRPEGGAAVALASLAIAAVALFQILRNTRASWLVGTCRDQRAVTLAQRMQRDGPAKLLVLPLQYAGLVTVEADKAALMMLGEVAADRSEDFYPIMEKPPAHYVRAFALDGLFLDRRYVSVEELALPATLADEEGPFAVYRVGVGDHA